MFQEFGDEYRTVIQGKVGNATRKRKQYSRGRRIGCPQIPGKALSCARGKQIISFLLKLLRRDLSPGVGLQVCVELIVFLHAGFASRRCRDSGTEFLKVHTYPVKGKAAPAIGTFNSSQRFFPPLKAYTDVPLAAYPHNSLIA